MYPNCSNDYHQPCKHHKQKCTKNCIGWFHNHKEEDHTHCVKCEKKFLEEELIPVKTPDFKWRYYCGDCIVDNVDWCVCCGEAYELPSDGAKMSLCEDCFYDMYYATVAN